MSEQPRFARSHLRRTHVPRGKGDRALAARDASSRCVRCECEGRWARRRLHPRAPQPSKDVSEIVRAPKYVVRIFARCVPASKHARPQCSRIFLRVSGRGAVDEKPRASNPPRVVARAISVCADAEGIQPSTKSSCGSTTCRRAAERRDLQRRRRAMRAVRRARAAGGGRQRHGRCNVRIHATRLAASLRRRWSPAGQQFPLCRSRCVGTSRRLRSRQPGTDQSA